MSFDVLYLSPHPDDAVFSSGGAIALEARAGHRVGVVTVFSRTSEETESDRREEDRRAIELLGAERIELGFADAPVRDARYRRPSWLLGAIGEREAAVVEEVRAALERLATETSRFVAPLGVGQHIDHQITHAAARGLDCDLSFYEDVPYALEPFAVARRLSLLGTGGPPREGRYREMRSLLHWWSQMPLLRESYSRPMRPLAALVLAVTALRGSGTAKLSTSRQQVIIEERIDTSAVMNEKLEAIAAYRSQWPLFFQSIDDWRTALTQHGSRLGSNSCVERRWRIVPR